MPYMCMPICIRYIRGWLIIDLSTSLPIDALICMFDPVYPHIERGTEGERDRGTDRARGGRGMCFLNRDDQGISKLAGAALTIECVLLLQNVFSQQGSAHRQQLRLL